ncbi:hypothetical protein [Marinobacter zhejiangensis]|uniref:PEP-CTERM protein-sorting domain-containing protein n=1 Tax=Marinobacter zhejiangensis TaxID=488535 RepID=A0A1I4RMZ1_9GAMM|nr:hypothetical protein [Marinobacter zhejiangensis]SFM53607.1 PEP-CTERM protein-sorting domain-containing protein [Marinobacter zhejiangensis]
MVRVTLCILLAVAGAESSATPINYFFEGETRNILVSGENYAPDLPLVRSDGTVIASGHTKMTGYITLDPDAWRDGAGGSGLGQVLSWGFSTEGLDYQGGGGEFHTLLFNDSAFEYLDEAPHGGYGPDVVSLIFNFNSTPFDQGANDLPVSNFSGGSFSTGIDLAWVNDQQIMQGIEGTITKLWRAEPTPVPTPSTPILMATGLLILGLRKTTKSA